MTTIERKFRNHIFFTKEIGEVDTHDGESIITYYHVCFNDIEAVEDLFNRDDWYDDFLNEFFPCVSCQHPYDCCGHFYPNRGDIIHKDEIYGYLTVIQYSSMNI